MSFVGVVPDIVAQAAGELESLGSTLSAANAAAAAATTRVVAPGLDEVSAVITAVFNQQGLSYQALSAQAATFHSQFANLLNAGTVSYNSTEIANARAAAAFGSGSGGIAQSVGGDILSELVGSIPGVQEAELAIDVAGPAVVALPVLEHQTAFVSALQTGNLGAATAALSNPAVEQAFLYGQDTVSVPLPGSVSGVQSVTLNIPFGGVLAPNQPITVTETTAGNPPITVPIPGTEVGGIIAGGPAFGPSLLLLFL
ncbi:MAG TPA: PE family protein [Mycobacterium sp.]|nr:PE family protein [Mycobacterium sp.]HUH71208.1 PE family protein [Mycobacterium sp.]